MAGSYPQYSEPYPGQPTYPAQQPSPEYPGMMPPPVEYPKRRPWRLIVISLVAVAVIAGIVVAIVFGVRSDRGTANQLSGAGSKAAIQNYLNALSDANIDTIARNTLCGMYDAVHDKRSDQALAKLSSDAFRKQFAKAEVTSIDKVVYWSSNQAQVLFTMRVTPAIRGAQPHEEQGIAQVLAQDNRILVCSYLLRTAAVY
jgi:hypothetical protein